MENNCGSINLELSKARPLQPGMGCKKKPTLIENPAAALTLRTNHLPRDIVSSCMAALIGVQPVGAFDESVTWAGGEGSGYGHRKAAFLGLGGFCCLAKPLTITNYRYVLDIWTLYAKSVGTDGFSDSDSRILNDMLLKFQDYVNNTYLFRKSWTAAFIMRHQLINRKGCPDLEDYIDELFKNPKPGSPSNASSTSDSNT